MKPAALIEPNLHHKIDALYQEFLKQNLHDKIILIILSVIYKPIGITKFAHLTNFLTDSGFLPAAKKEYRMLPANKKRLSECGLLIADSEGLRVNRLLANRLASEIDLIPSPLALSPSDKLMEVLHAGEQVAPVTDSYIWQNQYVNHQRFIRDLFLLRQMGSLSDTLAFNKNPQIIDHAQNQALVELLFIPFNLKEFLTLPHALQYQSFATLLRNFEAQGLSCSYPVELLEQVCAAQPDSTKPSFNTNCHHLLAQQYLYQQRFEDFERVQPNNDVSSYGSQLLGAYCFIKGEIAQALNYYETAITAKNKISRRKNQYLNDILGYFYKLALIVQANQGDTNLFTTALQQIEYEENDRKVDNEFIHLSLSLGKPIVCLSSGQNYSTPIEYSSIEEKSDFFGHQLSYFTYLLAHTWCNKGKDKKLASLAKQYSVNFEQLNYSLFAQICQQLAASFSAQDLSPVDKLANFTTFIQSKSKWDLALDKLIALSPKNQNAIGAKNQAPAKPVRVIWELVNEHHGVLQAREQKLNKTGWSKGRVISLKRLKKKPTYLIILATATSAFVGRLALIKAGAIMQKQIIL